MAIWISKLLGPVVSLGTEPVHDWFTEGFDTQVPKDAKALLEELA